MIENKDLAYGIFVGVWVCLGLAAFFLFYLGHDYRFKVKYYPPFVVGTAVVFLVFAILTGFPPAAFLMIVPALTVISYLNIHNTRFCRNCGKGVVKRSFMDRRRSCPRCGATLPEVRDMGEKA